MSKKDKSPTGKHSVVVTKGVRTVVTHSRDVQSNSLSQENKRIVKDILGHEMYTQKLHGQERINGLLSQLVAVELLTPERFEKLNGTDIKLDSVKDVEALLNDDGEN